MLTSLSSGLVLAQSYATDRWADDFLGFDANQRFVVVLSFIGCVTAVAILLSLAAIIGRTVRGLHGRHVEARLKRDMLDRGMSADDIAKVIEATPVGEDAASWWASCCPKK